MLRKLTLLLLVALPSFCKAQDTVKIAFHKDKPVQILEYSRLYDEAGLKTSKRMTNKTKRFTKPEVDEIFRRLAKEEALLPPELYRTNQTNREALAHYRAYEQASWSLMKWRFSLVWIPKDENMHMPPGLQPPTGEGSLWYTGYENLSRNGRNAAGRELAEAGTPVGTGAARATQSSGGSNGGIQVSSADMSEFTRNASQGSFILYYGWNNQPASAYIYEVRGAMTDKKAVADALVRKTSQSGGSFIGFEQRAGDCRAAEAYVRGKSNGGISTTCSGTHAVE